MPLEEYKQKRDFAKTPEPAGEVAPEHAALSYVIQKHAASHLHYDFRIELDGVMLSWAVPKGPSLDPSVKRLAMRVEDHPVDYAPFEGVIPKGEYGGGTVMVWDRGTWRPDHGDPREHLEQGHLKFYLLGERLRGKWMLVRTRGYGGARDSWLLFKEHDEEERPASEFDPTTEWTTSVATGRTMQEIAADMDHVWHASDAGAANAGRTEKAPPVKLEPSTVPGVAEAALPEDIDVELATLVKTVPEGEQWIHEVKFDGYRILALLEGGQVRLLSRNHKDWSERFQVVADAVAKLPARQAVLDGEVVVLKPDGTSDFQALQSFVKQHHEADLQYFVFDLLHVDGWDLRGAALLERKRLLAGLLADAPAPLHYADHIEGHGDVFLAQACEYSLEGVVSKRRDSAYRSGRGRDWLKSKCLQRQEFVVVAYTDPGGGRSKFGALGIATNEADGLLYVGRVGTGFTEASLADIYARLEPLEVEVPPVMNPPRGAEARGIHWVEPRLVAEVSFAEWTSEGSLRHPSFAGLREDKAAEDVVRETPADGPAAVADEAPPVEARQSRREMPKLLVAGVALTNPERELWPDVPLTKLELVRYYERVQDRMLPYVIDRPLSLVRCPTGYTGECFYQKHIENFPASVDTVGVWEDEAGRAVPYGVVHGLDGVVALAQMSVLEIHPWGSREDRPESPDRLIFDIDPDPELPFRQVAATALLLRSELSHLGLRSWLKATGGKGLHVVVPINRRPTWDEARAFSRAFVDHIVRMEPRMFTANMSKSRREGRLFIDYLRNARGATAIAPFSTRARPGAPIAATLDWSDIEPGEQRPAYSVATLDDYLAAHPRDPWAEIVGHRQSITKAMLKQLEPRP